MNTYILFLSALFTLTACILGFYNWKYNKNIIFLSSFLLLIILDFIMLATFYYNKQLSLMSISLLITPFLFLKAPMIYFYIRGVVNDSFIMEWKDIWHLLPFVVYYIINLPFLLPFINKESIMHSRLILDPEIYKSLSLSFYPMYWNSVIINIQCLTYLIICIVLLNKSHKNSNTMYAQYKYQYRFIIQKLYFLTFLLLIASILNFTATLILPLIQSDWQLINILLFSFTLIPIYFFITPKLLFGLPHVETTHISATNLDKLKEGADGS